MDVHGASSSNAALQRLALKDLGPDLNSILVVAMIIGKQRPRKFTDKTKENEQIRAVWEFTVRDSPRDYINVTYWGPSDEVCAANDKFYTGDVVEIRNPRINVRRFNEAGEQYSPMVTSPYNLTLNENSQIVPYKGDSFHFTKLLKFPTKPLAGFVPLRDIHNEGGNMADRFIDILAAVRSVGPIKNISTKSGEQIQVREIVVFDHTSPGLRVNIWDTDNMTRANMWKPRTTILFIADTKVVWSGFLRSFYTSITNRSIVTENPIGQEAVALANYAKSAPLETTEILEQLIIDLPDPDSIQNIMCVQHVRNRINYVLQENLNSDPQFTALLFVFITQLDLDGLSPVTRVKCSHCKSRLKNPSSTCETPECPAVSGTAPSGFDVAFDIKVHLADHTGTLTNCRLSGATAEQILDCTIQQFLRMTDGQKCKLKWRFLMERCAVRIVALVSNRFMPRFSIVSCTKANPTQTAQRIPIC